MSAKCDFSNGNEQVGFLNGEHPVRKVPVFETRHADLPLEFHAAGRHEIEDCLAEIERTSAKPDRALRLSVVWQDFYRISGKRIVDVIGATAMLVTIFPLLAIIAVVVTATDRSRPIFTHKRVGRDGRRFYCLKFRSMVPDAKERLEALLASDPAAAAEWAREQKLQNDPRITQIGRILRATSLDELPQLFNVFLGDMSLIGPRPITEEELPRYGRHAKRYLAVRPGMTGLWQVSGRNHVTYDKRVALDVCYTRLYGPKMDLKILLLTPYVVIAPTGQ